MPATKKRRARKAEPVLVRATERLFDGQKLREEGEEFLYHGKLPLGPNAPVVLADEEPEEKPPERRGKKHGEAAPEWTTEGAAEAAAELDDDELE